MSSAAENNSEVAAAVTETVKTAGDKEPEVTPGSPGATEEDAKAEIKGTKRPAEVSTPTDLRIYPKYIVFVRIVFCEPQTTCIQVLCAR